MIEEEFIQDKLIIERNALRQQDCNLEPGLEVSFYSEWVFNWIQFQLQVTFVSTLKALDTFGKVLSITSMLTWCIKT